MNRNIIKCDNFGEFFIVLYIINKNIRQSLSINPLQIAQPSSVLGCSHCKI